MASSNIKLFDENKGNMLTDTEFDISTQRLNGLQAGIASSQLQNKAMYQASLVAYAIAQIMMQNGLNANDTDAVSAFVANLSGTMLQKVYDLATTAEAQAGVATGKWMSPALVKAAIDKTLTDKNYLPKSGGTMTGNLILNANPTANLGAATKQYVDALAPKIGDVVISKRTDLGSSWALCDGGLPSNASATYNSNFYNANETFEKMDLTENASPVLEYNLNGTQFRVTVSGTSYTTLKVEWWLNGVKQTYSTTATSRIYKVYAAYGNGYYMICYQYNYSSDGKLGYVRIGSSLEPSTVTENKAFYSNATDAGGYVTMFKFVQGYFIFCWPGSYRTGYIGRSTDGSSWTTEATPYWYHSSSGHPTVITDVGYSSAYGYVFAGGGYSDSSGPGTPAAVIYFGNWPATEVKNLNKISIEDGSLSAYGLFLLNDYWFVLATNGIYQLSLSAKTATLKYSYNFTELTAKDYAQLGTYCIRKVTASNRTFIIFLTVGRITSSNNGFGQVLRVFEITNGVADATVMNTSFKNVSNLSNDSIFFASMFVGSTTLFVCAKNEKYTSYFKARTPNIPLDGANAYIKVS